MQTRKYLPVYLLIFIGFVATRPAVAQYQDSMGGAWNNAMSASASTMIWSSIFYRTTAASRGTTRTSSVSTATSRPGQQSQSAVSKATDQNAVKFRPAGTHIKTKELADSLGNTPAEREQYQKLMNAVLDAFDQQAQKAGFRNDVAAALAFFLGENIRIYRGMPDLSDQQYIDLRNAIADAVIESGAMSNMTDRQKQEMYEALVAYTGITQFGYEQGVQAQNDAVSKGYQKVAGQNLQTVTKLSPDSMNFGPQGLSGGGDNSQVQPDVTATGEIVKIGQLRSDYSENEVRANQLYKGKRFVFTGNVVDVSGNYYKTTGTDPVGRPITTNLGTNLRVSDAGTVIGFEVHCFFRDNSQLGQLRGQQRITFEATVQGREEGSSNLVLVDAVIR